MTDSVIPRGFFCVCIFVQKVWLYSVLFYKGCFSENCQACIHLYKGHCINSACMILTAAENYNTPQSPHCKLTLVCQNEQHQVQSSFTTVDVAIVNFFVVLLYVILFNVFNCCVHVGFVVILCNLCCSCCGWCGSNFLLLFYWW